MHRFHVPAAYRATSSLRFSAVQSRQIARVLRMHAGEHVEVFDGAGTVAAVQLDAVSETAASGVVEAVRRVQWPFPWRTSVCLALIRPQRFEWAVEKAAELGASTIVPLLTERTAHGGDEVGEARLARWQRIAVEAAEQCGSAFTLDVRQPATLQQALQEPARLRLIGWEDQAVVLPPLLERVAAAGPWARGTETPRIALYVGPEGGFAPGEIEAAVTAGCEAVTLGPRILRAETAAVAALAMLTAASLASG